jgi:ribosomal protein L40E
LAEANIEAAVLLIATVCAILFAVPAFGEGRGRSIVGMILSAGGILFSCGVLYFNFSALSILSKFLSIPNQPLASPWIMFFGFLVLGISGIIILIGACLPIAISVKQLFEVEAPRVITPELVANVKYCSKCGAGMALEATYCPRCGKKQAKS